MGVFNNQLRSRRVSGLPLFLATLISGHAAGQTPVWDHNPASISGPFNWGAVTASYGTCGSTPLTSASGSQVFTPVGAKQAPINISTAMTVEAILPKLSFRYEDTPFEVENTGHVVEVVYEAGSVLRIGKSVMDEFTLAQFHFHAPSEHMINGKQYDAELHLVHTNALGEFLVVGVMLNSSRVVPGLYTDILAIAPLTPGSTPLPGKVLNAHDLLPRNSGYYTYTGSLTTPPCTESVRWIVMSKPVDVPDAVIRQLHSIIGAFPGYKGYPNNNRPIVPLNGRAVVMVR